MKHIKLPVALFTMTMTAIIPAYADDAAEVLALKKEVQRLKQALEQSQKQLSSSQNQPKSATASTETRQTAPAVTSKEETKVAQKSVESPTSLLNEIQVHARKRSEVEKLKGVTKSISQVSGTELERFSANNFTDILQRVGNVNWNYGNPRTGSLTLRGLTTGSNDTIDPSVGVVVDGVSYAYNPLSAGSDYFDIDSVNVTRGPQGTAGHKNVSLGEIVISSRKPVFATEADASVTWGQLNTLKTQAMFNTPVIKDQLTWRTSFYRNQADGNYKNAYGDLRGRSYYVNTDRTQLRTQFLYTPTDTFKGLFSFQFQPHGGENLNGLTFKQKEPLFYQNGGVVNRGILPEAKLKRP